MSISHHIFRAYDIRGIVDNELTPEAVYQIGQAFGSLALEKNCTEIVIARDGRSSGLLLSEALQKGLLSTGCHVIDIGAVPTPVLYFATYFLKTGSGIMLTGSHNPANYNGLKMMLAGQVLSEDTIQDLYQRILHKKFPQGNGRLEQYAIEKEYIEAIKNHIILPKKLKIVVDAGNGITGSIAPKLYRALGMEVIELFCEVDGTFPNHHPDPSKPKNLVDIIEAVKKENADLGFAFDGDGDRLGLVTASSEIIAADRQMCLYAKDILARQKNTTIIFDVKCSRSLKETIEKYDGIPLMWKTGHSHIKNKMKEINAPLAGEMSGHIFFKERWYGFDDALYTGARLLEILTHQDKSLDTLFEEFPAQIGTPELNLDMPDSEKFIFISKLITLAKMKNSEGEIITLDGLRIDFNDGFGLVRASNTTPCLVIRFEASSEIALTRIQAFFRGLLLELEPSLILPF